MSQDPQKPNAAPNAAEFSPDQPLGRVAKRHAAGKNNAKPPARPLSPARKVWDFISPMVYGIIAVILIRTFVASPVRVDGTSMMDTLYNNERMIVTRYERFFGLPDYGQIIICHFPLLDERVVKRVVGLPGDVLEMVEGILYRNGEPVEEPYLTRFSYDSFGPVTVAADSVFVLGDNRPYSHDSRVEGSIHKSNIFGNVQSVFYPFDRMRTIV